MSIEKLPDEVLSSIFRAVDQRQNWRGFRDPAQYSLCLVSRRFHRIATPVLFAKPDPLGTGNLAQVRLYHRALLENPALRLYCRKLALGIPNSLDEDARTCKQQTMSLQLEVIRLCSATQLLFILGDCNDETSDVWSVLRLALECMGNLTSLEIRPLCSYFSMGMFAVQMGSLPLPRKLITQGYLLCDSRKRPLIPSKMLGTSRVTTLQIDFGNGDAEMLINMIRWPSTIEHLDFTQFCNLDVLRQAPLIVSYLAKHSASLKTLRFGYLCECPENGNSEYQDPFASLFDLSSFSALRSLELSTFCHGAGALGKFTDEVGRRLLPPNLEHITWHYKRDSHEGWWKEHNCYPKHYYEFEGGTFTEKVAQWLVDLCGWARDHGTKLRSITVYCTESTDSLQLSWYPFIYILRAKEEIFNMGIAVEIVDLISYEDWQEQLDPDYEHDPYKEYAKQDAERSRATVI